MMSIFLVLGLLLGIKAEVTPVFVKTGEDLLLDIQTPVTLGEEDQITWRVTLNNNDQSKGISRFPKDGTPVFKDYLGRAEFFVHNFSLLLKSVTKSDSGDYRAHVTGDDNKDVAEYKVTVLDPVSPVSLTVNCCSDSSNLTVTCSTQDSLIRATFTCDKQTCSEERGDRVNFTAPAPSLHVYLDKESVICEYSNQVSREKDITKIEDFCERCPDLQVVSTNFSLCRVKIIVISAGLIVMVCAVISVHIIEKAKRRKQNPSSNINLVNTSN